MGLLRVTGRVLNRLQRNEIKKKLFISLGHGISFSELRIYIGIVTRSQAGRPRNCCSIRFTVEQQIYLFSKPPYRVLGPTQHPPPFTLAASTSRVKRHSREFDDSSVSRADVKDGWRYSSTFPYALIRCTGIP
jgi:hypothetical protein